MRAQGLKKAERKLMLWYTHKICSDENLISSTTFILSIFFEEILINKNQAMGPYFETSRTFIIL